MPDQKIETISFLPSERDWLLTKSCSRGGWKEVEITCIKAVNVLSRAIFVSSQQFSCTQDIKSYR